MTIFIQFKCNQGFAKGVVQTSYFMQLSHIVKSVTISWYA